MKKNVIQSITYVMDNGWKTNKRHLNDYCSHSPQLKKKTIVKYAHNIEQLKVVATRGIIDLILCKRNSEQRTLINWIISFLYCAYLMRNQSICIMHLIHKYWTKVSVHVKCNVQENRFLSDYMFVKWCVSLWCFYAILIDICIFHVKSDGCKLQ